MNGRLSALGVILVVLAGFMFYIVFAGGQIAGITVTGTNQIANFMGFLYVIVGLPIGSGLAYAGLAYRPRIYAAGGQTGGQQQKVVKSGSGVGGAGLAIGIIALIVAFSAIGVVFSYHPASSNNAAITSLSNQLSSQVSSLNSEISALKGITTTSNSSSSTAATLNIRPTAVALKIDWCNTDNTGQDRYCPGNFVVAQGDVVQILFISNDTDAHTFTLQTNPYSFQINLSYTNAHDFLTDQGVSGNCQNGTSSQITSGVSGTYCVSGSSVLPVSLLQSSGYYAYPVAQNPNPAAPLTGSPLILNVTNSVYLDNVSSAEISTGGVETWGIGAFQATTPGIYEYFCHYHVSNGMFGYMIVLPNSYCDTHASACNIAGS